MAILDSIDGISITPETDVYTNSTEVSFQLNFVDIPGFEFQLKWYFGDGSYSNDLYPTHTYTTANDFTVRCIVYKKYQLSGSDDFIEFKKVLKVRNYVDDKIEWATTYATLTQCKKSATPFKINFTTSLNEYPKIRLYSDHSKSQPFENPQNKWSHLKPQWRFTNPYTISNRNFYGETIEYLPINPSNVSTIYNGSTFAGLSGFGEFYYIDDMPSNDLYNITGDTTPYCMLNATLEYSPDYLNTPLTDPNAFLSISANVLASIPTALQITTNGIKTFTLDGYKWLNKEYGLVVSIIDDEQNILKQYPINNNSLYKTLNIFPSVNGSLNIVDNGLQINRTDSNGFPTGGYYRTTFSPLSACSNNSIWATWDVQQYNLSSNILHLSGQSETFDCSDYYTDFRIVKVNENFDMLEVLKGYAMQETIKDNPILWDSVMKSVVGDIDSDENDIGKMIHEKIANFVKNGSDIDYCNLNQFYSMCEEIGFKTEGFSFDFPAKVKRLVNIFSINLNRLKGNRNKFNQDFGLYTSNVNMGEQIVINPYTLSAGEKLVIRKKHTESYELIELVPLDGNQVYDIDNLSAYGLDLPIFEYSDVYKYVEREDNSQNEGIINWEYTKLTESLSSYSDWMETGGIMESAFDFYLRDGLNLLQ